MERRIGSSNREAERRIMDALQIRLSARMERAMTNALAQDYAQAADKIERYEPFTVSGENTGRILLAGWDTAAQTFGNRLLDQIGKRHGSMERKEFISGVFRAAFLAFATNWVATKVTQINRTTEEQIRDLITQGEQEGAGVEEIARAIRQNMPQMSRLRSHVIARTETHMAASWANQTAAEESGIELVKEWCSSADDRTRETHIEADGQRVPLSMSFNVGGYSLMYPGDPTAPAAETVMCRCQSLMVEP